MVEFLSDYEVREDGSVLLELDGEMGKYRMVMSKPEADACIARINEYNETHPEESEAYNARLDEMEAEYHASLKADRDAEIAELEADFDAEMEALELRASR